jgi:hypothetical protein
VFIRLANSPQNAASAAKPIAEATISAGAAGLVDMVPHLRFAHVGCVLLRQLRAGKLRKLDVPVRELISFEGH